MLTVDLFEKWTEKYKKSIDCSHPKGFSQKAHCAGRKKHNESVETDEPVFIQALRDFLPIAAKVLELNHIPKIVLKKELHDTNVPTFGRFTNEEKIVYCVINNRQPNDILRTLAHELVHYKQGEEHELSAGSWHTGSPVENDASARAGVIMRHFNTKYPKYLKAAPIILPDGKIEESKHCDVKNAVPELKAALVKRKTELKNADDKVAYDKIDKIMTRIAKTYNITGQELHDLWTKKYGEIPDTWVLDENFADGKNPGRKGLAKRSGVDCKQSVTKLRDIAKHSSGERQRMAHWCANMKAGKK
jgi:hypothetical protein